MPDHHTGTAATKFHGAREILNTIRTARSRTSGEYLFDVLDMTPSSQGTEPATFPERFKASLTRTAGNSNLRLA